MRTYVLASTKAWNIDAFSARRSRLPGRWLVITAAEDLSLDVIRAVAPRYIFFMHWSSIVPATILAESECVCFHMADVPYGRGGSPVQNLIQRGHVQTKLTALRMTTELDAGPVYGKIAIGLEGSAREIFTRAAEGSLNIMERIIAEELMPVEQEGEPFIFKRRTPAQSELPKDGDLTGLYDHIRMLDAPTYPHAFIDYGRFRLTFGEARREAGDESLTGKVRVVVRQP